MSMYYYLVCDETRQKARVGQGYEEMQSFYYGEPDTMIALHKFLNATKGRPLRLANQDVEESVRKYEQFMHPGNNIPGFKE